jgi:hypothetical protein
VTGPSNPPPPPGPGRPGQVQPLDPDSPKGREVAERLGGILAQIELELAESEQAARIDRAA